MLQKYAVKNTLRQKRRSLFTILMMVGGFVLCGFAIGWTEGAYDHLINTFTRIWTGHLQIHQGDYLDRPSLYKTIDDYEKILNEVRGTEGVEGAAPRIRASGLGSAGDKTSGLEIIGIEPRAEERTTGFSGRIQSGEPFESEADSSAILGTGLAEVLEAEVGDSVAIISQAADGSMAAGMFRIRGTYSTGNEAADRTRLYLHIDDAGRMFVLSGRAHEILVVCNSLDRVEPAAGRLKAGLQEGFSVDTWKEVNPVFYRSMKSDKAGGYYAYVIISIIVAVGVLNTVLMSVLERTKEYGVLKALGTRPGQIVRMLYLEVSVLALVSAVIGSLITLSILIYFEAHPLSGFGDLTVGGMSVSHYPTAVMPAAFYVPALLIVGSTWLVSIFPAYRAAKISPARAMIMK